MRHSLITKLIGFLLLHPLVINCALSQNINNQLLSNQLEEILNERKDNLLKAVFSKQSFYKFNKQSLAFRNKYKDSKWSIKMTRNDQKNSILDVKIKSTRTIGDQVYNLHTKQTIEIETYKNKIKNYKVIDEESILSSQESPLIVKIISPNKVLTGERYEINLIIEKPLDDSLTAGGMIILNNNRKMNLSNDLFGIIPNQSGGLFKYIQAPLEPGSQIISAIITHPKGIYSFTKKIKVGS